MSTSRRTPAAPPEIPGFVYQRLLGSGGFSDVYLYEQQLPRRLVAVKVLLGGDDLNETSRQAFIGEANLMAQMSSHPYIVTIFHADVAADGRPYFVMEYAPGKSLSERYKTEVIPVEEVLRTGVRVASAVATAHQVGILHRDIKPANILANDYGWPALTDFGISSAVDDELADAAEGETTATAGMSVPWSPPEMFSDHPVPDARSEVFSLGATVYTALAGHSPFEIRGRKNGTIDLIGRIERGQITPVTRSDAPRSLIAVLQRAMSVRPTDRYATVMDFARALQRVELELGFPPTPIDVPKMNVAAPASAPAGDFDATSTRQVATIDAQGTGLASGASTPAAYEGARASEEERTSTRSVIRIAAQRETGPGAPWSAGAMTAAGAAGAAALDAETTGARAPQPIRAQPIELPGSLPGARVEGGEADSGAAAGRAGGSSVPTFAEPELRAPEAAEGPVRPVFERGRIELPEDTASGAEIAALRGGRPAVSTTAAAEAAERRRGDHADPYGEAPKKKSPNLLVGILAGLVVVLLAVLIVLGWVFRPKETPAGAGATTAPTGVVGAAAAYPPSPVAPISVRDSSGYITFRWENPDPQSGDSYYWRLSDKSQAGQTTQEPTAVVGPSPEGVKVCINVEIRRNGKTSAEPLVACYPQ
ncbi:Serine/threonine-protein kinase PknK [Pseudoclavibacter triregionum]|nr:Serine/threonine-protein kinase PknK [Pseudoclavibacter triregionum]